MKILVQRFLLLFINFVEILLKMNSFGLSFRVSIFGESHGEGIGIVLDGVPQGISLSGADFDTDIARRSSGARGAAARGEIGTTGTTPRIEADEAHILSGVFNGHTTGAPLAIIFHNTNTRSTDYQQFSIMPRPGHADYVASVKWGNDNDPRGGGHFSGRITLPIVAAGVIAKKILGNVKVSAELIAIGGCEDRRKWQELLKATAAEGDSLGGIIECTVDNVPVGLGEPFFDSVESLISHAIFSIPGIRGIEFGDGFRAAAMKGSEHNDPVGECGPEKNGCGGANGGISNGAQIKFRVAVKPTSSIAKAQQTWNFEEGRMDTLRIKGRHDTCFALRTPVIVEAMTAIVLADLILR